MPALDPPYRRPTSLSDPFHDFTEDTLAEILVKGVGAKFRTFGLGWCRFPLRGFGAL